MAYPRVFTSYDFDNDRAQKTLFIGQSIHSQTPFDIQDWSSKAALPQREWEQLVRAKINKCNMVVVLVGPKTYTATGVIKEIDFARSQNVPYFGVYVAGANQYTPLPTGLPRNRVIPWRWDSISNAIDQLMNEGKNL
ncbi:MAG: TIR domain-containing protein [Bacteroidota bacterium]